MRSGKNKKGFYKNKSMDVTEQRDVCEDPAKWRSVFSTVPKRKLKSKGMSMVNSTNEGIDKY